MDTKQARALITDLFQSESEEAVIEVLKKAGLWEFDEKDWKILGAKENNQAIVGNQTIQPHNALVEKLKGINGQSSYNSNVFNNVDGHLKFLDEIQQYLACY